MLESRVLELRTPPAPRCEPLVVSRGYGVSALASPVLIGRAMRFAFVFVWLLAACERDLVHELPDAPADASDGCPAPKQPLSGGQYLLYLNTEGVTLTKGNPDSATNTTDLISANSAVIPPFLNNQAGRDAFITSIATMAQDALAPYSIDVVTSRPVSRTYYMFVIGGDGAALAGCTGCYSVTDFGCRQILPRNDVDLMFDLGTQNGPLPYVNTMLSDLGSLAGLVASSDVGDCECRVDPGCTFTTTLCTFGSAAPTTNVTGGGGEAYNCGLTPTQDEPKIMAAALGCR